MTSSGHWRSPRREYPAWSPLYLPFFERYIDCEKFPLANREIMLVEDFVDGPQVTVEGLGRQCAAGALGDYGYQYLSGHPDY